MARPSSIEPHPRFHEIQEAFRNKVPFRSMAKEFGVSLGALSRYSQAARGTPQPASLSDPDVQPVSPSDEPSAEPPIPPAGLLPPAPVPYLPPARSRLVERGDHALFDVVSMAFPWQPGETKPDQVRALRLRAVQQHLGISAVKEEVFALVGDFRRMRISEAGFARQLDVPPEIIPQWVVARDKHDQHQLLQTEAVARVSRDHADLSDAIAQINMKLAEPELGMRVFAQLTQQKTRLIEQRAKLLERHGLDKITVEQRDTSTQILQTGLFRTLIDEHMACYEVVNGALLDEDELQAKLVAERRAEHASHLERGQNLPPFDPEDPSGWKFGEQSFRRKRARRLAGLPDSTEEIPRWPHLPKDLDPVVDDLRALAARPVNEPEPADEDGETGCPEPDEEGTEAA